MIKMASQMHVERTDCLLDSVGKIGSLHGKNKLGSLPNST